MKPRHRAAAALLAGAVIWEFAAPEGELLSHAADDYVARLPVISRAIFVITALHLSNLLPMWIDPYSKVFYLTLCRARREGVPKRRHRGWNRTPAEAF